jgi:homoserine kinase
MTMPPDQNRAEALGEIVVPGSISNLGPAFDSLSVAIQLYLRVRVIEVVEESADRLDFEFVDCPVPEDNRIARAFRLGRERIGAPTPGLRLQVRSEIPVRAGLGSSGAAAVAGLRLYEALTGPRPVTDWLRLASEIEGHPDNAAAALNGGLSLSCQLDDGRVTMRTMKWPASVQFVVATPDTPLETARARAVLPPSVPLKDAIFNLQRALLLLRALQTEDAGDLREAIRDRWHQPYRAPLVVGLREALAIDHPAVLGTCLSGAGPSVVALTTTDSAAEAARVLEDIYRRLGVVCTIRTLKAHQS